MEHMTEIEQSEELVEEALDSERGASMVEYALLIAFIAIVAIGALTALGTTVSGEFSTINSGFTN